MIKDSGNRREFNSGAVRDIQEGKGRCDLLPLEVAAELLNSSELIQIYQFTVDGDTQHLQLALELFSGVYMTRNEAGKIVEYEDGKMNLAEMLLEVSVHFEEGSKKYGERNWEKGIPAHCYIDSAIRHYLKWLRGDSDEQHDRAFAWNLLCCIWTCRNKLELNDFSITPVTSSVTERM